MLVDPVHIDLDSNAEPYALRAPHHVAILLLPKIKEDMHRLKSKTKWSQHNGVLPWSWL